MSNGPSAIQKAIAKKQKRRQLRQLSADETKRLTKLNDLLHKLHQRGIVQNRTLSTWLTESEYASYQNELQQQKQLRSELSDKPPEIAHYEKMLSKALFIHNRADGYATGKHKQTADRLRNKAEVLFEEALQYLEETISQNPHMRTWLDREPIFVEGGPLSPSPVGMPRTVMSRSLDNAGGGLCSMLKTIRETKIEAVERAIERLKYQ